jgi:hypothetical protein
VTVIDGTTVPVGHQAFVAAAVAAAVESVAHGLAVQSRSSSCAEGWLRKVRVREPQPRRGCLRVAIPDGAWWRWSWSWIWHRRWWRVWWRNGGWWR